MFFNDTRERGRGNTASAGRIESDCETRRAAQFLYDASINREQLVPEIPRKWGKPDGESKFRLDGMSCFYHNAVHNMLGEFEYVLITVTAGLGERAYGAVIRQEIEKAAGRTCSIGALYTTIERLETKGLLRTWMGEATPQRGGRAKRMVRVTPEGVQAATDFYSAMMRVSRNAAWAASEPESA